MKTSTAPARETVIAFRTTSAESASIDRAARDAGLDRGDYLRALILAPTPKDGPARHSHGATLSSPRLKAVYEILRDKGSDGATGFDLARWTNGLAIATTVSEIRRCLPGDEAIECKRDGTSEEGRAIYRYRLVKS